MMVDPYPVLRCDGKFEFLFYDIRGEILPQEHRLSCEADVSVRSQRDGLETLSWILCPTLEIESIAVDGEHLSYQRQQARVDITLPEPFQRGDELTLQIRYQGPMLAVENETGYNGYVGPEGVFMRPFAGWIPYATVGPECFQFPDVPYLLEMRAPADWTLFAHPEHPEVQYQGEQVVYRWDGRQPDTRIPHWGIVLLGGKYRKLERQVNGAHLTFFSLDESDGLATPVLELLTELLAWLDETTDATSAHREFRLAETPFFIQPTYQPTHTSFYSRSLRDYPRALTWQLVWEDIQQWKRVSDVRLEDVEGELGDHLHDLFWASRADAPEGWLDTTLAMRARGYLACIQKLPASMGVNEDQALYATRHRWVWWMWHRFVGEDAFYQALARVRNGQLPREAPLGTTEFFRLMGNEAGMPADWYLDPWFDRVTAPKFKFTVVQSTRLGNRYRIEATVYQPEDLYRMPIEVALRTRSGEQRRTAFMHERDQRLVFECDDEPVELEIDPDQRLLKVPSGAVFQPTDLGFPIAFGARSWGLTIPVRSEEFRHGKRLVVAPAVLMDVAEGLCPYLGKRQQPGEGIVTADPSTDRSRPMPIPVEIRTPEEASDELLATHNLVLIGTPASNPLLAEWGPDTVSLEPGRIMVGEVTLDDAEQGLIAFGPHRHNAHRFCLVITGMSNVALKNPPDFTEMPGDYLLYRDGRALRVGYRRPYRWVYRLHAGESVS